MPSSEELWKFLYILSYKKIQLKNTKHSKKYLFNILKNYYFLLYMDEKLFENKKFEKYSEFICLFAIFFCIINS